MPDEHDHDHSNCNHFDKDMVDFLSNPTRPLTSLHVPMLKKILRHNEKTLRMVKAVVLMAEDAAANLKEIIEELETQPLAVDSNGVVTGGKKIDKPLPNFDPSGFNFSDITKGLLDGK